VAPYTGSKAAIAGGYRYTINHPIFTYSTHYVIDAFASDLLNNTSTLSWSFTTEDLMTVTGRIGINGGYDVTITGSFPIGVDLPTYIGPAGDYTDSPCYGGFGLGYHGRSDDGATLTVYSPPVVAEGIYNVTVNLSGSLARAGTIKAVEVPAKTSVGKILKLLAPWMSTGPRR
jgi:hypothetical protein